MNKLLEELLAVLDKYRLTICFVDCFTNGELELLCYSNPQLEDALMGFVHLVREAQFHRQFDINISSIYDNGLNSQSIGRQIVLGASFRLDSDVAVSIMPKKDKTSVTISCGVIDENKNHTEVAYKTVQVDVNNLQASKKVVMAEALLLATESIEKEFERQESTFFYG